MGLEAFSFRTTLLLTPWRCLPTPKPNLKKTLHIQDMETLLEPPRSPFLVATEEYCLFKQVFPLNHLNLILCLVTLFLDNYMEMISGERCLVGRDQETPPKLCDHDRTSVNFFAKRDNFLWATWQFSPSNMANPTKLS